jgi:hypothetical protein
MVDVMKETWSVFHFATLRVCFHFIKVNCMQNTVHCLLVTK